MIEKINIVVHTQSSKYIHITMTRHNISAQISTTFTPCTVESMHYKKAIICHTQKINTVHVLETFLSTVFSSQCVVDYDAMPFPNTWGQYCTSGVSRFIIILASKCEIVLIFLCLFSLRPHPALWLLSRGIFQNINNAEHCTE